MQINAGEIQRLNRHEWEVLPICGFWDIVTTDGVPKMKK